MNWLKQMDNYMFCSNTALEQPEFSIETVHSCNADYLTEIGQFMIAPVDDNTQIQIPVKNKNAYDVILQDLAPHFDKVQAVYVQESIEQVILSQLKAGSQKRLEDLVRKQTVSPLVRDLYRSGISKSDHFPMKLQWFQLINAEMDGYGNIVASDLIWFIENTFLANGTLAILPTGWKLNDDLKNSIALRFFARHFDNVCIGVSLDMNVEMLQISNCNPSSV
ncbi:hypothetical protein [Paenibacillus kobensis]|uniref:hypothetical protein n=1 Tax=Paenibacillus kobensis TaxID=59841 RepID=UPI000FD8FF13|nr:hypothetical protein [Paenibacillus kobensis]